MSALKAIQIDREHFGALPIRLGDSVSVWKVQKFKPRKDAILRGPTSRSVMYTVTSLDPLLAVPISATFVKCSVFGQPIAVKTRQFSHG